MESIGMKWPIGTLLEIIAHILIRSCICHLTLWLILALVNCRCYRTLIPARDTLLELYSIYIFRCFFINLWI